MPIGTRKDNSKVKKIIGFSVGIPLAMITIVILVLALLSRRRNRRGQEQALEHPREVPEKETGERQLFEVDSFAVSPKELDGRVNIVELDTGRPIIELPANSRDKC